LWPRRGQPGTREVNCVTVLAQRRERKISSKEKNTKACNLALQREKTFAAEGIRSKGREKRLPVFFEEKKGDPGKKRGRRQHLVSEHSRTETGADWGGRPAPLREMEGKCLPFFPYGNVGGRKKESRPLAGGSSFLNRKKNGDISLMPKTPPASRERAGDALLLGRESLPGSRT